MLTLYTKGNYAPSNRKDKLIFAAQVTFLLLMIPFSVLIVYFTQFQIFLQLALLFLFLGYSLWVYWSAKKKQANFLFPLAIALLVALLFTVHITTYFFNGVIVFWLIGGHFLFWILYGWFNKIYFLMIIGFTSALFLLVYTIL
ncbi:hypothetical protein KM917_02480 [Virgibacillus pantothenticus]|uniref:hypothetical protein n=2 Tax=Bacillaceae TaxID=186817 RepID=UPI00067C8F12|nr:hypothetical protein [Virgibacillus pantothenticus]API90560.1 hypothetical protein BKP57_01015 [Virgibacillus sp. 6R]MBS7429672.1 hypothetical protein [Virgibacillus sp. 19R1-5]MBU8647870.1 hypothetical protein [Virgibacillus pantothenticus]MBU8667399.1 hypothetical protein [Virgibacillus pantothenticus]MBU8671695.1 hypothetical protein [Virgibacillus pantothenticus]